mmetsp:Transcript_78384/g.199250  ORF Transcript_78384/g.199250 Transcript_78384/m.199250 type:complete len:366 (+) Transcript_78384:175-1272(+)
MQLRGALLLALCVVHSLGHAVAVLSPAPPASLLTLRARGQARRAGRGLQRVASATGQEPGEEDGQERSELGVPMEQVTLDRAREQLSAARAAEMQAEISTRALYAGQQQLVAEKAKEAAEIAAEADMASVPDTKAALEQTRRFSTQAVHHSRGAKLARDAMAGVPEWAAEEGLKAVRDKIRQEAYSEAESTAVVLPAEAAKRHLAKVVESVAAAMEPYHLALLKAQKQLVISEAKAHSAARSATKLSAEATKLATDAVTLQAQGLVGEAVEMMNLAHGTSQEQLNMQLWAVKLHAESEQLKDLIPRMQSDIQQAAIHASQTVGVEVVPVLPPTPPWAVAAFGGAPAPAAAAAAAPAAAAAAAAAA